MIKTILKTSVLSVLVLSAGVVSARDGVDHSMTLAVETKAKVDLRATMQPPINTGRPKAVSGEVRATSTVKAGVMERREDKKENIQDRSENRYKKMLERFQATIDRETSIMGRINSRIAKIKAEGGNTVEAEKLTASAKIHLDTATLSLAKLTVLANTQASLEISTTTVKTLRDGLDGMRKLGTEIGKHLREAHKDLQKTIGVLRGNSQLKATTTAEVRVQN